MAIAGSGVIPRKATLEAPVLPANRRSRRQPTDRTRDSIPLSENNAPGPVSRRRTQRAYSREPIPRTVFLQPATSLPKTRSLRRPARRSSSQTQIRLATPAGSGGRFSPLESSGPVDCARLHPWRPAAG
jgi:hypothetical protein